MKNRIAWNIDYLGNSRNLEHFLLATFENKSEVIMNAQDRLTKASETLAREMLVERIEDILDADLNYLFKLSTMELENLSNSLERLVACPGYHISMAPYFFQ